jgi:hypothetical protein
MYELEVGRVLSNVKGMALDKRASATPKERNVGVRLLNPFPIIPKGTINREAKRFLQQPPSFIILKPFLPGR